VSKLIDFEQLSLYTLRLYLHYGKNADRSEAPRRRAHKNSYRKIENARAKERINKINVQIEKLEGKGKSLEKRVLGISSLVGFVFSIFFLSSNLTGNIIGNLDSSSANLSGILIFLASLLFGFLALKK